MSERKQPVAKQYKKGRSGRQGTPLTVYFSLEQAERLKSLSEERHVAMATLVRIAVDRLFIQLSGGQLELPLGL
jgi:hypothetical protein